MAKEKGFTLIELVVVIVILGILSVTAVPKFIDLQSDARIATLEGMQGALESGTSLTHMKAVIEAQTEDVGIITVGGIDINLHSGFPLGEWESSMRYVIGLDNVTSSGTRERVCEIEWCGRGGELSLPSGFTTTSPVVIGKVFPKGYSYDDECGVYFINYLDGNKPEIALEMDDC